MRILLTAVVAAALGAAAVARAEPGGPPAARLGLDTPVVDLILDPRTAKVIEKRMPDFVRRMANDAEFVDMVGRASLNDLSKDPHVDGLTPEILARLKADLDAAQAEPPP